MFIDYVTTLFVIIIFIFIIVIFYSIKNNILQNYNSEEKTTEILLNLIKSQDENFTHLNKRIKELIQVIVDLEDSLKKKK